MAEYHEKFPTHAQHLAYEAGYAQGYADAREDAAKVAMSLFAPLPDDHAYSIILAEDIAAAIRAMKPGEK